MIKTTKIESKSLDLLLVIAAPPQTAKFLTWSSGVTHPLGAAYIAAYVREKGFSVEILDNSLENLDLNAFREFIAKKQPLCVGFSTFTNSVRNSFLMAKEVKEVDPDIFVVMGGAHASALPYDTLKHPYVDIVAKGEGEITTAELLQAIRENKGFDDINGIYYKKNGQVIGNPEREPIKDIDSLPMPAYDLLPMKKYYLPASRRMGKGYTGSVMTGRGCPYRCTFCSRSVFGSKVRLRKPELVVDEIQHLVENYGVEEFLIWDDIFIIDKKRAIEICRLIKERDIKIIWSCSSRVDCVSDELFRELSLAGCREILLGAESGSQKILDLLHKDITLQQTEEAVRLCKKNNMLSFCTFVIGSEGETEETLRETLEFVKRIDPNYSIFCLLAPLPGSKLFDDAVQDGRVDLNNVVWDDYVSLLSTVPPPIQTSSLSKEQLVRWQKKIFREFYLRPSYIWRHIMNIRSFGHIYESFRGISALLGHQLHQNFKKAAGKSQ
jgi:radical SAM superfamily enzyme YgiQ (UPF0313 family)